MDELQDLTSVFLEQQQQAVTRRARPHGFLYLDLDLSTYLDLSGESAAKNAFPAIFTVLTSLGKGALGEVGLQ